MKKIAIFDKENKIINPIKGYFSGNQDITAISDMEDILKNDYDLIVLNNLKNLDEKYINGNKIINIHPSLLPAFDTDNAIADAFTSGVKVSGVTIHTIEKDKTRNKILAQYPVLIGLTTHIDEFIQEIDSATNRLLPAVIESVINDEIFDFSDLFRHKCANSCSSCGKCNH